MTTTRRRTRLAHLLAPLLGLTVLTLAGLAGCELTAVSLATPEDVVVAEVYLRAGEPTQQAFLHRTLGTGAAAAVTGATVRVAGPDGVLELVPVAVSRCATLAEAPELGGTCYEGGADGFVRPGATYRLDVTLADGDRLVGETTVPGDFRVVRPAPAVCAPDTASYELVWTRSAGAWAYQVEGTFSGLAAGLAERGVTEPPDSLRLVGLAITGADTTLVFPQELGVFDRFTLDRELLLALAQGLPAGAAADVVVAAGDRNFVNWSRGGNFNPSGQVRVPSVTGDGTGVFASLVLDRRRLTANDTDTPSCP